jgi:mono/diheme cytochrome c family protein
MPRVLPIVLSACSLSLPLFAGRADDTAKALPPAATSSVDFAVEIQPLLQKNCFSCHGPEHQEGGLRLDQKQRALIGGDNGAEIAAGKSAESRLIRVVAGIDDDIGQMPPEGKGKKLSPTEIGLLRAWIDQGAKWPDESSSAAAANTHWSLQPVTRPVVPAVTDGSWPRQSIDVFVMARQEAEKISHSEAAEKTTLLRRLYLDLIGLLPRPEEVHEFMDDKRPDAIERLVDRLLASPHFGERWGRHWLDLARYADSDGYEKDRPRPFAFRYRDWVIAALNADMPFDRFTIEQLAGDMLPNATQEQRVAVGLHRNTLHNTEGGTDQEEDRVKKTVDRTNTLGTVWLGMTVGCAQCHSHKYDPLTQREYYSLFAFFNSLEEKDVQAPNDAQAAVFAAAKQAHAAKLAELQSRVAAYEKEKLPTGQQQWEKSLGSAPAAWQTLELAQLKSANEAKFTKQADGSFLVSGKNVLSDVYTAEAIVPSGKISAVRLEVLPDAGLPANGPGRNKNGNFVLATFRVTAAPNGGEGEPAAVELAAARADFSQKGFSPELALNDNKNDGWAVSPQFGKRHVAVFEAKEPFGFAEGTKLTFTLDQTYNRTDPHNIGRFRLSLSSSPTPVPLEGLPQNVIDAVAKPRDERTAEQREAITAYYRTLDPELVKLDKEVKDHVAKAPVLPQEAMVQSVAELAKARETHINLRGDFLSPGDVVTTDTPAFLPAFKTRRENRDRLDLSNWLVDPTNPLPARVTVNRIWHQLFGRGIVPTLDDFGKQGEKPSHPELLDWLASEFVSGGWSQKALIRRIVGSSAYQQSSAPRSDLVERDPENVFIAHQARRRVEAEVIRDLALEASGLMTDRVGGPSVRPPQAAEYATLTYANSAKWVESGGSDRYRRGLYTFFQRTSPYPMLMTFDSPDSNECTARRQTSNTPLQALTIWNDPAFFEAAQALGRRVVADVPAEDDAAKTARLRADRAFLLCLNRQPSAAEASDVFALYQAARELAEQDKEGAKKLVGELTLTSASLAETAAWVAVGRTILNLDEFITRE